jgi:hypothetical protein
MLVGDAVIYGKHADGAPMIFPSGP